MDGEDRDPLEDAVDAMHAAGFTSFGFARFTATQDEDDVVITHTDALTPEIVAQIAQVMAPFPIRYRFRRDEPDWTARPISGHRHVE